MQGLSVFDKGIGYLEACLSYYNGETAYMLLYVLGLIYLLLKGTEKEKQVFLPCSIFLLLTVYNPVAPVLLDHFFDVNSEYYRFFWITPIVLLIPFLTVKLIFGVQERKSRWVLLLLLSCMLLLSGRFLYRNGILWADNIYKMPEDLMAVSKLIHEDTEAEYPKVFLEYEYNMQMRQYDPKLLLTIDREDYLYAVGNQFTEEMLEDPAHPQYKLIAALIKDQKVDMSDLLAALEETHTEYVVLDRQNQRIPWLTEAGLETVGEAGDHVVLKYRLKEPYTFELVDYSVVY
ncbi:MAG: hypothetical protein K6G83_11270 [Lachnospiraceae bacterium]|nr:hypothetical protein [Lachnospiraceae bacterium]